MIERRRSGRQSRFASLSRAAGQQGIAVWTAAGRPEWHATPALAAVVTQWRHTLIALTLAIVSCAEPGAPHSVDEPYASALRRAQPAPSGQSGAAAAPPAKPGQVERDAGRAPIDESYEGPNPVESAARDDVQRVAAAIEASGQAVRTHTQTTKDWTWLELDLHDQTYPLSIDLLGSNVSAPHAVVYMLPGGATNFRSSFLIPSDDNLAQFFRAHGYFVVGITPREDTVPADTNDTSFMDQWGMTQHRQDIRSVVSVVQSVVPLPYELLGHSYGAASALDYAAEYPGEPARVIALDIYSFNPNTEPSAVQRALRTYQAYVQLRSEGVYADDSYVDFATLVGASFSGPNGKRGFGGDYVRYTAKELLLFGVIYSGLLPGVHTGITGLPGDWPMAMSTLAGDPSGLLPPNNDNHTFSHISATTLQLVAKELGGGLVSMAFARDYWSVVSLVEGAHMLPWENITGQVIWLNSELGYYDQMYGAQLIAGGSRAHIEAGVVAGYGHADMLWSGTARDDVWERLLPSP